VLQAPRGVDTRPTSDKLRETLFNVLGARVVDAHFVDLYAGSGAVGIEALSRGAADVLFVEQARPAVAAIHANLASLKITTRHVLDSRDIMKALESLLKRPAPNDIVFLDPPYESAEEYEATLKFLGRHHAVLLAEDAVVVAEHAKKKPPAERYAKLVRTRVLEQGDAALSFYKVSADVS